MGNYSPFVGSPRSTRSICYPRKFERQDYWQLRRELSIIPFIMANLYYNDRLIIAYTSLNQSDKQWTGGAEITWRQDGQRRSHSLSGLADRFKSSEDAERFVISVAKSWIDANP